VTCVDYSVRLVQSRHSQGPPAHSQLSQVPRSANARVKVGDSVTVKDRVIVMVRVRVANLGSAWLKLRTADTGNGGR